MREKREMKRETIKSDNKKSRCKKKYTRRRRTRRKRRRRRKKNRENRKKGCGAVWQRLIRKKNVPSSLVSLVWRWWWYVQILYMFALSN